MTELSHTDDATTLLQKLMQATNEVKELNSQLILKGGELNNQLIILQKIKGEYAEIKAKIRLQKEISNSLKIAIRAEANSLSNI